MIRLRIALFQRFLLMICLFTVFFMSFSQLIPVFSDPLSPDEIQALNEWPNWVADACSGGTPADTASLTAGTGSPDGTTFPNLDPTAMANAIDKFIEKEQPSSPLKNLGATIVASAKNSNVNPFLIVGIADQETSLATANTPQVTEGHAPFNRRATPSQPHISIATGIWYKWTSFKASVDYTAPENNNAAGGGDIASYMEYQYKNQLNSGDLPAFIAAYDPSPSDAAIYLSHLRQWMGEMANTAGSAPASPSPAPSASNCSCSTGGSDTTTLTGNDNQQKIFNYFLGKGLSPAQAAGIDGNFGQESGWNPSSPGGYLAQWGGSRLTALEAFAQKEGKPVTDLGVQLDYTWADLTNAPGAGGDYRHVLSSVKATTTVEDATLQFMGTASVGGNIDGYENPGIPELQNRIDYANQIMQQYGSSAPGAIAGGYACGGVVNCNGSDAATTGLSPTRQNVVCTAQQELKLWQSQSGYPHPSFSQNGYLKYSQGRTEEWCADFATWVYNQASYPVDQPDWNVAYVPDIQSIGEQNKNFHWHPASSGYTPKPGDLAIHGADHVNIFVSSSGNSATYIGGDQGDGPYPGGSIVSTETGNGYYDNGITGYVSPD